MHKNTNNHKNRIAVDMGYTYPVFLAGQRAHFNLTGTPYDFARQYTAQHG
jgi:hypothetical protein